MERDCIMKFYCEQCGYETPELPTLRKVVNRLRKDGGDPAIITCGPIKSILCRCPICGSMKTKTAV